MTLSIPRIEEPGTRRASLAALAAAITVPTLLGTAPSYLAARAEGHPLALWLTVVWQAETWVFWVVAALLVLELRRGFPVPGASGMHIGAALALSFAHAWLLAISVPLLSIRLGSSGVGGLFARALGVYLPLDLVTYGAILMAAFGLSTYRERLVRDAREAILEKQLSEARLDALSMQMQPHFLFNALNTAAVLVRRQDSEAALSVLTSLGTLLRSVLQADSHERPLGEELAFLESYLSIQQLRFADRLAVSIDAADEVLRALVPTFVLQPLVENAIVHGIASREEPGGRVAIRAVRERATLRMEVRDNGPGLLASSSESGGKIGLANCRARLAQIYGEAAGLDIASLPEQGTLVTILLPYRVSRETPVA